MKSTMVPATKKRSHRITRPPGPQDRQALATPARESGTPLPEGQMDALRTELEDQSWLDNLMTLMRAAGNDTRVRILYLLWRRGEVRVNDLAIILGLTTPAISQQLKKLRTSGLVRARRDAQTIFYRLDGDAEFNRYLVAFFEKEGL